MLVVCIDAAAGPHLHWGHLRVEFERLSGCTSSYGLVIAGMLLPCWLVGDGALDHSRSNHSLAARTRCAASAKSFSGDLKLISLRTEEEIGLGRRGRIEEVGRAHGTHTRSQEYTGGTGLRTAVHHATTAATTGAAATDGTAGHGCRLVQLLLLLVLRMRLR